MNLNLVVAVLCCIGCANLLEEPVMQYLESLEQHRTHSPVPVTRYRTLPKAKDRHKDDFMK